MDNKVIGLILAAGALAGIAAVEAAPASAAVVSESATATGGDSQLSITFSGSTAKAKILMSIYYPGVNTDKSKTCEGLSELSLLRTSATRTETVYESRVSVPLTCATSTGSGDTLLRATVTSTGRVTIAMDVLANAEGTTTPLSGTTVTTTTEAADGEFVELVNMGGTS